MIKSIVMFKRKPGMDVREFQRYWREEHPKVVMQLPGIRRYVQSHPTLESYRNGREPAYDAVAEVWWDDFEALRVSSHSDAWPLVAADETHFIDASTRTLLITQEHVIAE